MKIIITAPSLDPTQNVSGVSSVVNFIIDNNPQCEYQHFQLGKTDKEKGGWHRIGAILEAVGKWKVTLRDAPDSIIHYSFPLSTPSILRDPLFMYQAYRKKGKMVIHVHGGLFLTAPKIPFFLDRILKWVFSWDVPFIVLSEGEKKTLQERFGAKKVYVLPNCPSIPNNCTDDTSSVVGMEKCRKSEPRGLVFGYLGRIEPNKGMTELLQACQQLKKEGVDFTLRFAGKEQSEGEYLPMYRQQLGENFEYVGLVSGNSKDEFLRSLDVFVMPTYFEGLPMSLLECMGYGVVPMVTPVGSIPDVVIPVTFQPGGGSCNGSNGIFLKVKDVDSIVKAVKFLDENREMLLGLSKNARKTILDNFSAERYVKQLNHIYNSL